MHTFLDSTVTSMEDHNVQYTVQVPYVNFMFTDMCVCMYMCVTIGCNLLKFPFGTPFKMLLHSNTFI